MAVHLARVPVVGLLAVVLLVVSVGVAHITGVVGVVHTCHVAGVHARRLNPFDVSVVTAGDYVGNIGIRVGETRHMWSAGVKQTGSTQGWRTQRQDTGWRYGKTHVKQTEHT